MNIPKPFTKKRSQNMLKGSSSFLNYGTSRKSCINMEELMQFEAARQRALAQMAPDDQEKSLNEFVPHRIFINHIDIFNGLHYVKNLSNLTREPERLGEEGEESKNENLRGSLNGSNQEIDFDEEMLQSIDEDDSKTTTYSPYYEIFGSLDFINNPKYSRPEGILELLDHEKKSEFLEKLLTCGFIIYDITSDLSCHPKQIEEAKWIAETIVKRLEEMEKMRPQLFSKYKDCRTFILVSTLLTWAKTKPIDPEDPSLPFTEKDFRKRKPHPNYRVHCELEKRIIELGKKYPNHFRTIVIGSGIPYGHEEDILHFYFKMAWEDAPHLPIFGSGNNILPIIHIDSLAGVLFTIMESFPKKLKYIVATDPHSVTLKEIVKLLAKNLGNGKTVKVSKEEAFLYPEIKQKNYDMLTSNINIVPGYLMDNMALKWGTDLPFNENISKLISEFKIARGLLPIKIFIHGPPASGKSFLATRLASHYKIPHLHVKGVIEETIQTLKDKIQALEEKRLKAEEKAMEGGEKIEIEGDEVVEEEQEDEDEEEESLDALKDSLKEIEENMDNERHRLDEEFVIRFFKEKMMSNSCKNKGYIIDGYPKTMEHTKALYEPVAGEEGEREDVLEEDQDDVTKLYNANIMPEFVESLDASDEFLIDRVIKLPVITQTHYAEHEMCRRLTEFRALNTEDNTPLIFYDELDIHPMIYNVENDSDPQMEPTFQAIIQHIGPPRNYGNEGTYFDGVCETDKQSSRAKRYEELKAQREDVKKAAQERRDKLEKWMFLKNQELEMEEKALLVMGMPLRHYLMKYIFPTLTRGLVEVARIRPDDPVDFLSEFLFRENPEGKMFQPNYEERENQITEAIKEYEDSLIKPQSSVGKSSKASSSTQKSIRSGAVSRVTDFKCSLVSSESAKSKSSKVSGRSLKSTPSSKSTTQSSGGICTCQKSPSLSTCSSDRTPSSPVSCTCTIPEPCEPCEPCDTPEEKEEVDPCKCPCLS